MRIIIETQGKIRMRRRTRARRLLSRVFRSLAGISLETREDSIMFKRTSRVREAVRGVVPDPLLENRQVRSMTVGLLAGSIHIAFAFATMVAGLLSRSLWTISVGVVVALLNAGKSYLASGALTGGALGGSVESIESLKRCRIAGAALALLVLVMSGTVARLVVAGYGRSYPGALIYLYAGYALVLIILAFANLLRARREELVAVKGVRAFNLAIALISVFALQTVLLSRVAWRDLPIAVPRELVEGAVGGAVCASMVTLGAWLALSANGRLRERNEAGVPGSRSRREHRRKG